MRQAVKQRFQYLFEDARRRKESYKNIQSEECTFAPRINKQSITQRSHSKTERSLPLKQNKNFAVSSYFNKKAVPCTSTLRSLKNVEKFLGEGIKELLNTINIEDTKPRHLDEFMRRFQESYKELITQQKTVLKHYISQYQTPKD